VFVVFSGISGDLRGKLVDFGGFGCFWGVFDGVLVNFGFFGEFSGVWGWYNTEFWCILLLCGGFIVAYNRFWV